MPASLKSAGTAIPVLFILTVAMWLYMSRTISLWFWKAPVPGNEGAKMVQQAYSGAAALVVWLLLGGILLLAGVKGLIPPGVGLMSWVLHPVSFVIAAVAIAIVYDVRWRWAIAIPLIAPLLIAAYALYVSFGSTRLSPSAAGLATWIAVMALCLPVLPAAYRFQQEHLKSDAIEDKPGPELDRFMARERERRRERGLEELKQVDEDTRLYSIQSLARDDSPVRAEALAAMRGLPNRQADAEQALLYDYFWILPILADIDVQPTPELCAAARHYLRRSVTEWRKQGIAASPDMGPIFEKGLKSIGWIAAHCDGDAELDLLDQLAQEQQETPAIRSFRESLAAFRREKSQ